MNNCIFDSVYLMSEQNEKIFIKSIECMEKV